MKRKKEDRLIACVYAAFFVPLIMGLGILGTAWLAPAAMEAFLAVSPGYMLLGGVTSGGVFCLGMASFESTGNAVGGAFTTIGFIGIALSILCGLFGLIGPWVSGWALTAIGIICAFAVAGGCKCDGCREREECDRNKDGKEPA